MVIYVQSILVALLNFKTKSANELGFHLVDMFCMWKFMIFPEIHGWVISAKFPASGSGCRHAKDSKMLRSSGVGPPWKLLTPPSNGEKKLQKNGIWAKKSDLTMKNWESDPNPWEFSQQTLDLRKNKMGFNMI